MTGSFGRRTAVWQPSSPAAPSPTETARQRVTLPASSYATRLSFTRIKLGGTRPRPCSGRSAGPGLEPQLQARAGHFVILPAGPARRALLEEGDRTLPRVVAREDALEQGV
jgi:hypothetical protein